MKRKLLTIKAAIFILFCSLALATFAQENDPVTEGQQASQDVILANIGTAFTYQGSLVDDSNPADGVYDFQFSLFDAASGGSQVSNVVTMEDVTVSDSLFTVEIDFGSIFDGSAFWLEVAIRTGSSTGSYTSLNPRQPLTAAPYALFSKVAPWEGVSNVPSDLADGDDDTTYSAGLGLVVNGTQFNVDTNSVQSRVSGNCAVGQAIRAIQADGTVVCQSTVDAALSARQAYSHNIVDQSGDVGNDSSITIGIDGLPIIAHYAADDDDLKVSHCNDLACTSATWTLVDTTGGVQPSITIGMDGLPLISYAAIGNTLRVAHCHDLLCNSADISIVDDVGNHFRFLH